MTRLERRELRKQISEANNIGARLYWVRNKLKLSLTEVCASINMPYVSFFDREAGVRTVLYEEFLTISRYFDRLWQNKYAPLRSYPTLKGIEVIEISFMWILFGCDTARETYDELVKNIAEDFKIKMQEIRQENEDLRNKLDMLNITNSQGKIGLSNIGTTNNETKVG